MAKPYTEIKFLNERVAIQRVSDRAFIPLDPANSDYAEFLHRAAYEGESNILEAV